MIEQFQTNEWKKEQTNERASERASEGKSKQASEQSNSLASKFCSLANMQMNERSVENSIKRTNEAHYTWAVQQLADSSSSNTGYLIFESLGFLPCNYWHSERGSSNQSTARLNTSRQSRMQLCNPIFWIGNIFDNGSSTILLEVEPIQFTNNPTNSSIQNTWI